MTTWSEHLDDTEQRLCAAIDLLDRGDLDAAVALVAGLTPLRAVTGTEPIPANVGFHVLTRLGLLRERLRSELDRVEAELSSLRGAHEPARSRFVDESA